MVPSSPEAFAGADRSIRAGLAARGALRLLRAYKVFVSPYFRGSCRFLPSCADYASEAIATHGFIRGGWLAVRRLSRCHPLCVSGYDPVPPDRRPMASGDTRGAASRPIPDARAV